MTIAAKALIGQVSNSSSVLQSFGGLFGTLVSGFFLYMIAILNLVILVGIVKVFLEMRRGRYSDTELEHQLNQRGLMFRFFGGLMKSIHSPWQMYPVGVLFGLGFDTATEVALLAATAGAATVGLPWYAILSLPILFASGMTIFDTLDGSFMNFAYGWAFSKPVRKVYYNITITGLSVAVALLIGIHRALRPAGHRAQALRALLALRLRLRHQPGRVHHRRPVRGDLGGGPRDLAVRAHRAALDRGGEPGPLLRVGGRGATVAGSPSPRRERRGGSGSLGEGSSATGGPVVSGRSGSLREGPVVSGRVR
jgi:HoxN/HupN/NixA family high-affinity nickel-transporter